MTNKNEQPQFDSSDDWLRNAINDAVAPSAHDLQAHFASLDHDEAFKKQLAGRKEEVLDFLVGKIPSADRLSVDLAEIQVTQPGSGIDTLEEIVYEKLNEADTDDSIGEPRTFDLHHTNEILGSVSNIATRSLMGAEQEVTFWLSKSGLQASTYFSPLLTEQDKHVIIEAAEHFIDGPSFDPNDPVQFASAQAELQWDESEEIEARNAKANRIVASILARDHGINTTTETYAGFQEALKAALTTGESEAAELLISYMAVLDISPEVLYKTIDEASVLANDPDYDEDSPEDESGERK